MRQILTHWTSPGSPGGLTVMYFDEEFEVSQCRAQLSVLWNGLRSVLSGSTRYTIDPVSSTINEAGGQLTGKTADPTPYTQLGEATGTLLPNASQGLLRWSTTAFRNNRQIIGRTYVPGMVTGVLSGNGELTPGTQTNMQAAVNAFLDQDPGLVIWSRPGEGASPGESSRVYSGTVWSELAVLRNRR